MWNGFGYLPRHNGSSICAIFFQLRGSGSLESKTEQLFSRRLFIMTQKRPSGENPTSWPGGLISKRRGRSSNRRKPEAVRTKALSVVRERYWDFGPTLAAEKLREVHQITLGRETLRLWMIEAGIWADRKQRRKQVHQPRHRRECVGELVQ